MPNPVEILYKITVQGEAELRKAADAQRQLTANTNLSAKELGTFDNVLKSLVKTGSSYRSALEDMSTSEKSLGTAVANAAKELLAKERALDAEAAAARKAAGATEELAGANRHLVTEIQGASASIRLLEGNLSIRAVEQYATKILGLGGAFKAIFPIVGALASVEVIERGIEKLGELYNAWNPVIHAEEEALRVVQDLEKSYAKLEAIQERILHSRVERDSRRPGDANSGRSGLLRFEAKDAAGEVQFAKADEELARSQIAAAQARVARGTVPDRTERRSIGHGETADFQVAGGLTTDAKAANAELVGLNEKLNAALEKQKTFNALAEELRTQSKDLDSQDAKSRADKIASLEKQAHEGLVQAQLGELHGLEKINAQHELTIQKLGVTKKAIADIDQQFAILTADQEKKDLATFKLIEAKFKTEAGKTTEETTKDERKSNTFGAKLFLEDLRKQIQEDEKAVRSLAQALDLVDKVDKDRVVRQANKAQRTAELTAGPGGEQVAANNALQIRLDLANKLFDIEARRIDRALTGEAHIKALSQARADRAEAIDKAQEDRALRLLEIRKKELDQFRESAGRIFDALESKGASGLTTFFAGFLKTIERTVFQNFATIGFQAIQKSIPEIGGQTKTNADGKQELTTLGKILAGTPFGTKQIDPLKLATDANTGATALNTTAIAGLNASMRSLALNATGRGAAGSSGSLGGVGSGSGETDTEGSGLPTDGHPEAAGEGSGEGGSTGAVTGASARGRSSSPLANVFDSDLSGGARVANGVAAASIIAAGVAGTIAGIRQGGARGALGAASSVLGTAAALDPEPISKTVLAVAALGTGLIKGLLGDPKKQFEEALNKDLQGRKYNQPSAVSVTTDSFGNDVDHDFRGRLRVLNSRPEIENYDRITGFDQFDRSHLLTAPDRRVTSAPPAQQTIVTVNVQAIDSKSFVDHHQDIAEGLRIALQTPHPVRAEIQRTANPV